MLIHARAIEKCQVLNLANETRCLHCVQMKTKTSSVAKYIEENKPIGIYLSCLERDDVELWFLSTIQAYPEISSIYTIEFQF